MLRSLSAPVDLKSGLVISHEELDTKEKVQELVVETIFVEVDSWSIDTCSQKIEIRFEILTVSLVAVSNYI